MRIYNKLGHTCYFPYAGSGRRGVNLKSQEQSPDLPIERVNHPSLRNDLKRGRIGVMLSPSDKASLRSIVDAETMALLEGAKKPEKPEPPAAPLGKQMDARPPRTEEKKDKADKTYEADAKDEVVDPVKEELEARTDMMSEEGKKEELDKLSGSDQPSVANAAEELKNDGSEDDQPGPEPDPATGDDIDDVTEPVEEAVASASEDAGADGDGSSGESDDAADTGGDDAGESATAEPAKQKTYKGIAKAKLLSLCMERELDATTAMKVKELRALLVEDDKKKAQG
jgi:hypothetical protein